MTKEKPEWNVLFRGSETDTREALEAIALAGIQLSLIETPHPEEVKYSSFPFPSLIVPEGVFDGVDMIKWYANEYPRLKEMRRDYQ